MDPTISNWLTLRGRLDALLLTHDRFQSLHSSAVNGAQITALLETARELGKQMLEIRASLVASNPAHGLSGYYFDRLTELVNASIGDVAKNMRAANTAELTILLSLLRNELDAFFQDGQEAIRLRAERAFRHLQWSIASTESTRLSWKQAYEAGETACESLGATHLLLHGIFAYKAHSPKARTDLVFHEPVDSVDASAVAEGLVLTEWKRVTSPKDLAKVIADAEVQADLYASGVLAGTELRRIRYVVVVTETQMDMPPDTIRAHYLIRHVNIAVAPLSPSGAAPTLSA